MPQLSRRLLPAFIRTVLLTAVLAAAANGTQSSWNAPAFAQSDETQDSRAERVQAEKAAKERAKRLEKLAREDREALADGLDFALPAWTAGMDWIGEAPSADSMRGKVVVVQTFTTKGGSSRAIVEKIAKGLSEQDATDVVLIAVHTPEGSERAETMIEKLKLAMPVAIDRDGAFCDAIGAFRKPVNVITDRTGDIKFAGLTVDGVLSTVKELTAVPFDNMSKPNVRKPQTSTLPKDFPTFRSPVRYAIDMRGKQSPPLPRVDWWNGAPNIEGKLLVVDFWATWCAPCRGAIPHMNQLAQSFRADIVCMGISNETPRNFENGLRDFNLKKSSFEYPVGTDTTSSMKNGFGVTGIPHVAVISNDGIVRWQGFPTELTADVIRQLVEANQALATIRADVGNDRWNRFLEEEKDSGSGRSKSRERSRGY
ncbi:MAG: TlpA family protein disulfide reductase [Phycisphaerae bacterium]|nr:TlpA family protein disulfide reductase [Phycisphaerae bacterium]